MPRRYDLHLAVFGFALLLTMSLAIAWKMPVFSPVDEMQHYDYAYKLAQKGNANSRESVDIATAVLRAKSVERAGQYYFDNPHALPKDASGEMSFQAYHPPLFYWLGAFEIKTRAWVWERFEVDRRIGTPRHIFLTEGLNDSYDSWPISGRADVIALRGICALMVVAARVLTFLSLRKFGRGIALAALPYLIFSVPVDVLPRYSMIWSRDFLWSLVAAAESILRIAFAV